MSATAVVLRNKHNKERPTSIDDPEKLLKYCAIVEAFLSDGNITEDEKVSRAPEANVLTAPE